MNTVDGHLDSAQAALCCLGYLAAFYDERADAPPEGFFTGLSVILGHIEDEVREAYDKITAENSAENSGACQHEHREDSPLTKGELIAQCAAYMSNLEKKGLKTDPLYLSLEMTQERFMETLRGFNDGDDISQKVTLT